MDNIKKALLQDARVQLLINAHKVPSYLLKTFPKSFLVGAIAVPTYFSAKRTSRTGETTATEILLSGLGVALAGCGMHELFVQVHSLRNIRSLWEGVNTFNQLLFVGGILYPVTKGILEIAWGLHRNDSRAKDRLYFANKRVWTLPKVSSPRLKLTKEAFVKTLNANQKCKAGMRAYEANEQGRLYEMYNESTKDNKQNYSAYMVAQFQEDEDAHIAKYGRELFLKLGGNEEEWNAKTNDEKDNFLFDNFEWLNRDGLVKGYEQKFPETSYSDLVAGQWNGLSDGTKNYWALNGLMNSSVKSSYFEYVATIALQLSASQWRDCILNPVPGFKSDAFVMYSFKKAFNRPYVTLDILRDAMRTLHQMRPVKDVVAKFEARLKALEEAPKEPKYEAERVQFIKDYCEWRKSYAGLGRIEKWFRSLSDELRGQMGGLPDQLTALFAEKASMRKDYQTWIDENEQAFSLRFNPLESKFVQTQVKPEPYQLILNDMRPLGEEAGLQPWKDLFKVEELDEDVINQFLLDVGLDVAKLNSILPEKKGGEDPKIRAAAVHKALEDYVKAYQPKAEQKVSTFQSYLNFISDPAKVRERFGPVAGKVYQVASGGFYAVQWTAVRVAYFMQAPRSFALGALVGAVEIWKNGQELSLEQMDNLFRDKKTQKINVFGLLAQYEIGQSRILGGRSLRTRVPNFAGRSLQGQAATLWSELFIRRSYGGLSLVYNMLGSFQTESPELNRYQLWTQNKAKLLASKLPSWLLVKPDWFATPTGLFAGRETFHTLWSTVRN